ncbi:FUSC family protein [Shewanella sp. 10N.286.52.B9]|uniref:FUSC family protein n=1 Tax=Shewanella sp. 10N.286.52.B9 TaxID=1880837 RepID=UPI000C817F8A|nr:FUSC family protein [Shewanella sp. 10N.286.52.B9]
MCMLSLPVKEAIKVSVSVGIAIALALFFQWEKPYWAAITVIAIASNETLGHGLHKGKNRLIGTVCGVSVALFLVSFFAQTPMLFIGCLLLLLAVSVWFADNLRYGYAFTMGFTVCTIVAVMGGFNGEASFDVAVLRIQDNLLGVLVYSIVYRFIWPLNTESLFFSSVDSALNAFHKIDNALNEAAKSAHHDNIQDLLVDAQLLIDKLSDLISMPLSSSYKLQHEKDKWTVIVDGFSHVLQHSKSTIKLLSSDKPNDDKLQQLGYFSQEIKMLDNAINGEKLDVEILANYWKQESIKPQNSKEAVKENLLKVRINRVIKAVSIASTCYGAWIYFALPGGIFIPMFGSIFANITVSLPFPLMKQVILSALLWGVFFLLQYIFIMPAFTELWQLVGFYMINVFLIWGLFPKPAMMLVRMLGGNLLMVMTMSALHLTPSYDINTPLLILVILMITVIVARFYNQLFMLK